MPDTTLQFSCRPELVGTARHAARTLLADTPIAEEAALIVSEFTTNSVRWSESGTDGRPIELTVECDREERVARVEVADAGRRRTPAPIDQEAADQHGRGLQLVAALAKDWGHKSARGRAVYWAVLTW